MLILTCINSLAQQKPSKEETVAFLNRTLQEVIGLRLPFAGGTCSGATFNLSELVIESAGMIGDTRFFDISQKYWNIRWDLFKEMEFKTGDNQASYYHIRFSNNLNYSRKMFNKKSGDNDEITENSQSNILLFTPLSKAESVKKAVYRLVEIAKEENKDPFLN
ncbi:hypothetical protein [Pedobacter alpinus]